MANRDVHMDSDSSNNEATGADKKPRACDLCRTRKIKCDKGNPCANCRASKHVCKTTQQVKQPRQRVLISNQYEKKIDAIEDRLAGIEQILQTLSSRLTGSLRAPSNTHTPSSHAEATASPLTVGFEGDTTLNAHSVFAQEVLERAVGNSPMAGQNPEMNAALTSLQNIVSRLSIHAATYEPTLEYPFSQGASFSSLDDLKLPPQKYVKELIEKTSAFVSVTFTKFFPWMPLRTFAELCEEVYRHHGCCSRAKLIIFHGGLFYLFYEYSVFQVNHSTAESFEEFAALCRRNIEALLSGLNLLMPVTMENIEALVIGTAYCVEVSKPSLCWTLNSTAASLCLALGYHRRESMKNDTEMEKKVKSTLFWSVYVMDKNLSLRLGRASIIQDYDISIQQPLLPTASGTKAYDESETVVACYYWTQVAEIQGQVYQNLYSPGSFSKSNEERAEWANRIALSLKQYHENRGPDLYTSSFKGDFNHLLMHSDQVVYHSVMTLIHRAIPRASHDLSSTSFSKECIQAARSSLQVHLTCASLYKHKHERLWSGYMQWSILNIPFTPFMVIFCHVITSYSTTDLDLLDAFVTSLKPTPNGNTEGVDKLYRLCHVFYQVAKLYVKAKAQEARTKAHTQANLNLTAGTQNSLNDVRPESAFDPYLSLLFAPNQAQYLAPNWPPTTDIAADWPDGMDFGNVNIQDWFSGNSNIMGLLDQDIDYINMG